MRLLLLRNGAESSFTIVELRMRTDEKRVFIAAEHGRDRSP